MNSIEYMNRAIDADAPRILRKHMTNVSEQVAAIRTLEAQLRERNLEDAAEQLCDAAILFGRARAALEAAMPLLAAATAPPPMGAGASLEDTEDHKSRLGSGVGNGQPTLLVHVLAKAGLISSSGKAKKAIRAGAVTVDGAVVSNPAVMLEPGVYEIACGEAQAEVRV